MDFYAAETNKLIIRLDKIVSCLPSEAAKRREHEQNVVTWVNDEDVQLCPQCAKSFNILRRKHHCRVCGTVQCHQCSQFLLLSFASEHCCFTILSLNFLFLNFFLFYHFCKGNSQIPAIFQLLMTTRTDLVLLGD